MSKFVERRCATQEKGAGGHEERSLTMSQVQLDIKGGHTSLNVKSIPQTNLILLRSNIQLIVLVKAIERPIEKCHGDVSRIRCRLGKEQTHLHQTPVPRGDNKDVNPMQICVAPYMPTPTRQPYGVSLSSSLFISLIDVHASQNFHNFGLKIYATWQTGHW